MKKLVVMVLVVLILAAAVGTSQAITGGVPDNGLHPYVGLVGFFDLGGNWLWRCSGTLLSPTVLLTAGHCTESPAATARVWFDETVVIQPGGYPYDGGVTGTPHLHPGFKWALPDTYDVGVVVLDSPVSMSTYGQLPELGFLDTLDTRRGQKDLLFTVVGYGLNEIRPREISLRTRYMATSMLVNLRSALTDGYNIHTSSNPGKGAGRGDTSGGTCFGDSGGPVFYGDASSNLVVGITSFGLNQNCKGADFAWRVDIQPSLDFLAGFGVFPQ